MGRGRKKRGGNMLFEVDFVVKIKSNFKTIYSTLVFAHTVNECKERASEIAKEKSLLNTNIYIQELIIPQS
ncbi:hypothetical protein [uncultured Metabacillus sp.]|uniref:hypothetical protein n=2 Tax=uncultured Metabacillus sp. TaxID=2860135 RepID=UPI00261AD0FD|nr:hypothetical protein [uncultured Metabacillus sp.]